MYGPLALSRAVPDGVFTPLMNILPTVTDYRGHHQTLFPVREINLKAYVDAILTQITWPALGIELRAMHKQPFKPATYHVKPLGQGDLVVCANNRDTSLCYIYTTERNTRILEEVAQKGNVNQRCKSNEVQVRCNVHNAAQQTLHVINTRTVTLQHDI